MQNYICQLSGPEETGDRLNFAVVFITHFLKMRLSRVGNNTRHKTGIKRNLGNCVIQTLHFTDGDTEAWDVKWLVLQKLDTSKRFMLQRKTLPRATTETANKKRAQKFGLLGVTHLNSKNKKIKKLNGKIFGNVSKV